MSEDSEYTGKVMFLLLGQVDRDDKTKLASPYIWILQQWGGVRGALQMFSESDDVTDNCTFFFKCMYLTGLGSSTVLVLVLGT